MSSAREKILGRIRDALTGTGLAEGTEPAPPERKTAEKDRAELLNEFETRWTAIGGQYHYAGSNEALSGILRILLSPFSGKKVCLTDDVRRIVPELPGIVSELNVIECSTHPDSAESAAAGITSVRMALAYSGTLVVTSRNQGELSGSLLPPVHIAIIPSDRIVDTVGEALNNLHAEGQPRGAVFITGPSRTADIELNLVMGVHGPGTVHAVVADF